MFNHYVNYGYTNYEGNKLRLVESSGISSHRYMTEIEVIIAVIKNNISIPENYSFDVNEIDGCEISFADHVVVHVEYNDGVLIDAEYDSDEIEYNEKENRAITVNIHIYIKNDTINEPNLRSDLTHELLHAYEDCQRLYKDRINCPQKNITGEARLDNSLATYFETHIPKVSVTNKYVNMCDKIAYLIYRLIIRPETNAFVEEVYADLKSLSMSKKLLRKNFHNDLKETRAFKKYEELRDIYESTIQYDKEYNVSAVIKCYNLMNVCMQLSSDERKQFVNRVRKLFRNNIKYQLNRLWCKLTRAAEFFYYNYETGQIDTDSEKVNILAKKAKLIRETEDADYQMTYTVTCRYEDNEIFSTTVIF